VSAPYSIALWQLQPRPRAPHLSRILEMKVYSSALRRINCFVTQSFMECRERDLDICFPVPSPRGGTAGIKRALGIGPCFLASSMSFLRQFEEDILYQHHTTTRQHDCAIISSEHLFYVFWWCMTASNSKYKQHITLLHMRLGNVLTAMFSRQLIAYRDSYYTSRPWR
jgi:hypothetical protein